MKEEKAKKEFEALAGILVKESVYIGGKGCSKNVRGNNGMKR